MVGLSNNSACKLTYKNGEVSPDDNRKKKSQLVLLIFSMKISSAIACLLVKSAYYFDDIMNCICNGHS